MFNDHINALISELNQGANLTASEVLTYVPEGKIIKQTKSGNCDLCGLWDSKLYEGACYVCTERYLK